MNLSHDLIKRIAKVLSIQETSVRNTISLLEEGATIPFISRYRKEKTGSLDEVQIGDIAKMAKDFKDLIARKLYIKDVIQEQNALTPQLSKKIDEIWTSTELEDLYLPFKRKKKTKAGTARANGLEPLAETIRIQKVYDIKTEARKYFNQKVKTWQQAVEGAQHIIAEWISEDAKTRENLRKQLKKEGTISSKVIKTKKADAIKYKDYFDFDERLEKCPSHRFLAMLRGQSEGYLRVNIESNHENNLYYINRRYVSDNLPSAQIYKEAIADGYKRLLYPSISNEIKNMYKDKADAVAIEVFAKNLKQLLLSPPLGQKSILAIDPGFRTGCKVVLLDDNGNLVKHTAIYPNAPQNETEKSKDILLSWYQTYTFDAVAIGNGTAGRETEAFIRSLNIEAEVHMVNEDGASIYSASETARNEFPNEDVTVRGSVSIGRRLMDPLAELVKIDAKSIGVGQYQHDVNQSELKSSLDTTVMSCVNSVGINLNTASMELLSYVSGLGDVTSKNIVSHRKENGEFTAISDLKKVARVGAKVYEQAAGFLRIRDGRNALDNTGVHPESYPIVKKMAKDLGLKVDDLIKNAGLKEKVNLSNYVSATVGLPTLRDILKELEKPGLDPRGTVSTFAFDARIKDISDVKEGQILPGIITNITNFGAFVDIGCKSDGLVHISQIANRFIANPADVLTLQQHVNVKVLDVDYQRGRINLSMKEAFSKL